VQVEQVSFCWRFSTLRVPGTSFRQGTCRQVQRGDLHLDAARRADRSMWRLPQAASRCRRNDTDGVAVCRLTTVAQQRADQRFLRETMVAPVIESLLVKTDGGALLPAKKRRVICADGVAGTEVPGIQRASIAVTPVPSCCASFAH
jgi:hypothetical protein